MRRKQQELKFPGGAFYCRVDGGKNLQCASMMSENSPPSVLCVKWWLECLRCKHRCQDGSSVRICGKGETEKASGFFFLHFVVLHRVSVAWPPLSGCCDFHQVVPRLWFLFF